MAMSKNSKILIEMAERKNLMYLTKSSTNNYMLVNKVGELKIYAEAKTQKELITKLEQVFFEDELKNIYESIK